MGALGPGFIATRRRRRYAPMAEINVTPFVDVMLVLLIVFMISAPLLTSGVPVELPQTQAKPLTGITEPITISIDSKGKIFLQTTEIPEADLVVKLRAIAKNGVEERIFVRGDQTASYGKIMRVMGDLNAAGFNRIALVTLPENGR